MGGGSATRCQIESNVAAESLGASIDTEEALHRMKRDVIDNAESLVCKLQEGDPELKVLDLGSHQPD